MTDPKENSRSVDLMEYQQLRSEINNRTALSAGLIAVQVAALGTGLSVYKTYPDFVIAVAAVSCCLWLLWVDHTSQVYKIAAYIGLRLSPRLSEGNQGVLGWEAFMREIDQGDEKAAIALFGEGSAKRVTILQTEKIGRFISLLFGGSPLILILGFLIGRREDLFYWGLIPAMRIGIWVMTSLLWIYALNRYILFAKMRLAIDQALLKKPESPGE